MRKSFLLATALLFVTATCLYAQTTYTMFQSTSPTVSLTNDGSNLEVGVRFRVTQSGNINGIRFYKGSGTTGTHTGHLWTNTGTLLGEIEFTSETSSGWQQALFSTPVAISTGVTYVASCHNTSGDYCATVSQFTSAVTNGPIKALADGEDGYNGIYSFASSPVFPTSSYSATNYFIDVIFEPTTDPVMAVFSDSATASYIPKFKSGDTLVNSLIYDDGTNVGIGTTNPQAKLAVNGDIYSKKVKVTQSGWSDYVFEKGYRLPTLEEIEEFIQQHKHLPEIPSAKEIEEHGLNLGDNQALLLKKIEELTLYIIAQDRRLQEQEEKIRKLQEQKKNKKKK